MASTASKTAHRKRLAENDSCVLYHQTDLAAARAILSSQKMLRGSGGLVGGGIYFAASSACTQGKAHSHGVVLSCEVRLGSHKNIDSTKGCPDMTYTKLLSMNRDSVMITGMQTGVEFVVYNFGQISNIKWHSGEKVTPVHDLAKGQRVQAQHKQKLGCSAGVICYLNSDGTYDVKFDDGNKEEYIPRKKIKKSHNTDYNSDDDLIVASDVTPMSNGLNSADQSISITDDQGNDLATTNRPTGNNTQSTSTTSTTSTNQYARKQKWNCSACTMENDAYAHSCNMCNTPKPLHTT